MPIRIERRTEITSLRPYACATMGMTAIEKPEPR